VQLPSTSEQKPFTQYSGQLASVEHFLREQAPPSQEKLDEGQSAGV
jgi:hypothetical protein